MNTLTINWSTFFPVSKRILIFEQKFRLTWNVPARQRLLLVCSCICTQIRSWFIGGRPPPHHSDRTLRSERINVYSLDRKTFLELLTVIDPIFTIASKSNQWLQTTSKRVEEEERKSGAKFVHSVRTAASYIFKPIAPDRSECKNFSHEKVPRPGACVNCYSRKNPE